MYDVWMAFAASLSSSVCLMMVLVMLIGLVALTRAKVRPEVDFEYRRNETVSELGSFGMGPWGSGSGFVDRSAAWIWPEPDAHKGARANMWYDVQYLYENDTGESIMATVHAITDDVGELYLNEQLKGPVSYGWWHPGYPKVPIEIQPGSNLFRVRVLNKGGPAGFIMSVVENASSKVLFHTDKTWRFTLAR